MTDSKSLIKASAPGSLMLFGEHAVLRGQPAISAALDKRIHVHLRPRSQDRQATIDSSLGQLEFPLDPLPEDNRFAFVLEAIRRERQKLPCGFDLKIEADFSSSVGFGSSAAVTVATLAALEAFCDGDPDPYHLQDAALEVIHQVQGGRGSGADAAASVFGGIVAYRMEPRKIASLQGSPPLSVIYCGYKETTAKVIAQVDALEKENPELVSMAFSVIEDATTQAIDFMVAGNWEAVGKTMLLHQKAQAALGVSNEDLDRIVAELKSQPGMWGAKISGSGLGDCVIGLGVENAEVEGFETLPAAISPNGVLVETVVD